MNSVLYDVSDQVAWITLNRPEKRNSLTANMVQSVARYFKEAESDQQIRCIVISGSPPAFCAGVDLQEPPDNTFNNLNGDSYPDLLRQIYYNTKPVIAQVNGSAFAGGLGLVGAADIAISAEDAVFCFSEVRLGVIPAVISVVCVPKLGFTRASHLFLTAERFSGVDAVNYGLIHKAVPMDVLDSTVMRITEEIKQGAPNATAECKRLIRRVASTQFDGLLGETASWSARIFKAEEALEGFAAFHEKRLPNWVASKQEN